MPNRKPEDPNSLGFWLFVGAMLFLCVPYLFMGSSQPRWWGVPVWLFVSLAATIAITAASIWRIWKRWNLERIQR